MKREWRGSGEGVEREWKGSGEGVERKWRRRNGRWICILYHMTTTYHHDIT